MYYFYILKEGGWIVGSLEVWVGAGGDISSTNGGGCIVVAGVLGGDVGRGIDDSNDRDNLYSDPGAENLLFAGYFLDAMVDSAGDNDLDAVDRDVQCGGDLDGDCDSERDGHECFCCGSEIW